MIHKWFISWCCYCLNAVVLYSLHCCFVLSCFELCFLLFPQLQGLRMFFFFVNLVLIVWWIKFWATRSPSSSAVIWIISQKSDFCCGKAGWKLFTSVWQLSWLLSSMSCLYIVCSFRGHNEALWKEWFGRTVIIFGNVVEIVCDNKHLEGLSTWDSFARNVRIRTTAAAGSAQEFGLKDCEIRVATMQSPSWLLWRVCVHDFKVPQGVYWSTRQRSLECYIYI